MLTQEEIIQLTREYCGEWGINHARRLLHLVSTLADGREYNEEAVFIAAYLHDWGGSPKWAQPNVEHQDRSKEVVEPLLTENNCPEDLKKLVLEIIVNHHGGDLNRSLESILFTDADALDLLGVIGTMRICCMVHRNLGGAVDRVKFYKDISTKAIQTEKGKELAKKRIKETEEMLKVLGEESFGYL
jgi:uncharacterized protein